MADQGAVAPPTSEAAPLTTDRVPPTSEAAPPTTDRVPPTSEAAPPTTDWVPPTGEAALRTTDRLPASADGVAPAFYAAGSGGWRDWWLLLHPPYTAWHLSYVVIGACLAPFVNTTRLVATLLGFFFAVGIAAHALDELNGRPLRTRLRSGYLLTAAVVGLAAAVALGVIGVTKTGWVLVPFIVVGPLVLIAYNAELFGGIVHNDAGFAAAWGAFSVLTAYVAQAETLALAPVLAALGAFALSLAQRRLSTPARALRRRSQHVEGTVTAVSGEVDRIDRAYLLAPLEGALRALAWSTVLFATALAIARLA